MRLGWNLLRRNHHGLAARAAISLGRPAAFGPSLGIVDSPVENLAGAQRGVPVFLEQLRQADPVGVSVAESRAVTKHARRSGVAARQQR